MTSTALLLCYMLVVVCLQLIVEARHVSHMSAAMITSPSAAPVGQWDQVYSLISSSKVENRFLENLPINREHRKYSSPLTAIPSMTSRDSVDYRSLTTVRLPSTSISSLVNTFLDHSIHPSTELAITPSPFGYSPPAHSNGNAVPTTFAQPPLSPQTQCCESNMVQKRGTEDCYCVYPVKVELFLQNVSMISNWSNEFLHELAYQLKLDMDQFEINNFYVVGASGLNITMDIVPFKGISFLADQVLAMNSSLALHWVHIDPELVGDYKLLNLTWFRPLASSPAPSQSISPVASPPGLPYLPTFTTKGDTGDRKHSNFLLVIGICIGILVAVTFVMLILCLCSSRKRMEVPTEEVKSTRTTDAASVEGCLPYPSSTRFLSFEELKEATHNFEPASMLGEGGFGRVFKGVLSDGTAVAIKKLSGGGHQGDKEFLVEVEMLSRLHHRNLVKLIGYYTADLDRKECGSLAEDAANFPDEIIEDDNFTNLADEPRQQSVPVVAHEMEKHPPADDCIHNQDNQNIKEEYVELSDLADTINVTNIAYPEYDNYPMKTCHAQDMDAIRENINLRKMLEVEEYFDFISEDAEQPEQQQIFPEDNIYVQQKNLNSADDGSPSSQDTMTLCNAPSDNLFLHENTEINGLLYSPTLGPSDFEMVDDLLAYFEATNDNLHCCSTGSQCISPPDTFDFVEEVGWSTSKATTMVPHTTIIDGASSSGSSVARVESGDEYKEIVIKPKPDDHAEEPSNKTAKKHLMSVLGAISPPAPFSEFPSLPGKLSAAHSASPVHVTAGIIQIYGSIMPEDAANWPLQKDGRVHFILSYSAADDMVSKTAGRDLTSKYQINPISMALRGGLYWIFISWLILLIAYGVGMRYMARKLVLYN